MDVLRDVLVIVAGYLLGAIPSGLIVGRLVKGIDLRDFGSGKTGATNALRTLGKGPAALVLVFDLAKGLLAVLAAYLITGAIAVECLAGLAAVIGHNWPVYAGFRGGRGVLVSFGIFWLLCWPAALVCTVIGLLIIVALRMVSLGVLVGTGIGLCVAIPVVLAGFFSPWVLFYTAVGAALIVVRHWDNIERIRAGTERKLGQPAQPVA